MTLPARRLGILLLAGSALIGLTYVRRAEIARRIVSTDLTVTTSRGWGFSGGVSCGRGGCREFWHLGPVYIAYRSPFAAIPEVDE